MLFFRPFVLWLAITPVFTLTAKALDWKATTLAVTTTPFQAQQDAVFEFTNHSPKPVTIQEVETSCSCLLASSDFKVYAPGASGKVMAKFTIGDRGGIYERSIIVITDEAGSPVVLTLKVEVPEIASVTPRSVEWKLNDEAAEKIIELKPFAGLEIFFSAANPTSDAYVVQLEKVAAGRFYRLHIKPKDTARPVSAAIRVVGREKSGHDVLLSAYANVR